MSAWSATKLEFPEGRLGEPDSQTVRCRLVHAQTAACRDARALRIGTAPRCFNRERDYLLSETEMSHPRSYAEFSASIEQMAAAATPEACRNFALDSICLLHESAQRAIDSELLQEELRLLSAVVEGVAHGPTEELLGALVALRKSMGEDPVRAAEFDHAITDLLAALGNWLAYRQSGEPLCVARLAITVVNSVDRVIELGPPEYSHDNMLEAPQMAVEYRRQQRLLRPRL